MNRLKRVIAVRTGGGVERCHGIRHQGSYSNAVHSWGVAMLLWELWPERFEDLALHCLTHDVPEAWVGDIPATTKRYSTVIKEACDEMERTILRDLELPCDQDLRDSDSRILKACDHLELYLWAREQMADGNAHAVSVINALDQFFEERPLPSPADELLAEIRNGSVIHDTSNVIRDLHR